MRRITVINATKGATIGAQIELADTFASRLLGLLGRGGLAPGQGLLIEPSSGVHTVGMSFPIDVVALDKRRRVVGTWRRVAPLRVAGLGFKTRSCLELAVGEIDRHNIEAGDCLEIADRCPSRCAPPQEISNSDDNLVEPSTRASEGEP